MRELTAYETVPSQGYELVAASHGRDWMDATFARSAYRCLPLLIANQSGWMILNPAAVRVRWDGGPNLDAIEIQCWQEPTGSSIDSGYVYPVSHFGVGVITWTLPFLFRTSEGYNLLVRGPANYPKDGVAALEGVVETDWTPATFTMNWKITRTDTWITFEKGEPIAMIVPQQRRELEEFTTRMLPVADAPELAASNAAWCASRDHFNTAQKWKEGRWERHYFQGTAPDGTAATQHQTRLRLHPFQ